MENSSNGALWLLAGLALLGVVVYQASKDDDVTDPDIPGPNPDPDPDPDPDGGGFVPKPLPPLPPELDGSDLGLIEITDDMTAEERAAALAHNTAILEGLLDPEGV